MGRKGLGELEQQVLLALLRLGGEAYSVPLVLEMEEKSGQEVAQSAVFIVLRRMEAKGLVKSRLEGPSGESTGRERRYFKLEPAGRKRLEEARQLVERLWDGIDTVWKEG
jgi:PadR family transcriptional regulator, regulatory protein PadR